MKIAVSGSSGFVGKYLLENLLSDGHEVISISSKDGIDITKYTELENLPDFDVFIHLSAKNFVPDSFQHPHDFYRFNILSTLNFLELCRARNAKFILISSYLYGAPEYLPIDESHPLNPHNPYAQTKLISEELAIGYHRDFNLPVIIFRPFNIYGLGQNENFLVPKIIGQIDHEVMNLFDPRPKRDLIYINDVVSALVKAVGFNPNKLEIFNLCSGVSLSTKEIAETVKDIFNSDVEIRFTEDIRPNEVMDTQGNNSKCKDVLGWTPSFSFREGVMDIKSKLEA